MKFDKNGREIKVGDKVRPCKVYKDYVAAYTGIVGDDGNISFINGDVPLETFRNHGTDYFSVEIV